MWGPFEEKKPKRKERAHEISPPSSGVGPGQDIPVSTFPSQPKPSRTYEQFQCIVCNQELSSKGVCKRHLEDQHVSPRIFECERCHAHFDTKPEAKKHCSQCGDGQTDWAPRKMSKKVYACEFTGSFFGGQTRYVDHLLTLSEQKQNRPRPNLNEKLAAIIRHWGYREQARVLPLCHDISQNLFGSPDAWSKLQWDEEFLQAKIGTLEHATFYNDGTVESSRWGDSLLQQRRSTEIFLRELLQAGRLPPQSGVPAHSGPPPTLTCTTTMPPPPSISSGPSSSVETPRSGMSPMPRSQSRQTIWSHDGMSQTTTASTPRSVPASDEIMTAELKSKRHLSDESRAYIPSRTPPGPPEPPDHYQYSADQSMMAGQAPQLPELPSFMTPSNSTMSLPLRKVEGSGLPTTQSQHMPPPPPQYHTQPHQMYPIHHPTNSTHTLASDTASETSTIAQSYREPEFFNPSLQGVSSDYLVWSQQQQASQFAYQQPSQPHPVYGYGAAGHNNFDYSMADDASLVASSVNTGNTIDVGYVAELPKMESFPDMDLGNHHNGTFYFPDDGEEER